MASWEDVESSGCHDGVRAGMHDENG